jgi:hypothetical protein
MILPILPEDGGIACLRQLKCPIALCDSAPHYSVKQGRLCQVGDKDYPDGAVDAS